MNMKKQKITDLTSIKQKTITLLCAEPVRHPTFPFLVQHPIFEYAMQSVGGDIFDIFNDAEKFATRFDRDGIVYRATVSKSDIICYNNRRNEQEIICYPADCMDITLL